MGNETFKKRQKESARREKQAKKAARLMERRNEKLRTGSDAPEKIQKQTGPFLDPRRIQICLLDTARRAKNKGREHFLFG
jgi:hypothetical protein